MPSGNACYKAKGATAKTHMASKTRMLQGKAVCSRAATSKASKAVTSKEAKAMINQAEVMDSKAQEVVMARQVSKADTINRDKEVALLGSRAVQGSTAIFR